MTTAEKLAAIKEIMFGKVDPKASSSTQTNYSAKDGSTLVASPKMDKGNPVHVKTADGTTPAPDGEYELKDGTVVSCEGGLCTNMEAGADEYNMQWSADQKLEFALSEDDRKGLIEKGQAMPDGSFPIRNKTDLKHAINIHSGTNSLEATKQFIKKRATELEAEEMLPADFCTENKIDMTKEELDLALASMKEDLKTGFDTQILELQKVYDENKASQELALKSATDKIGEYETKFSALEKTNSDLVEIVDKISKQSGAEAAEPVNTLFSVANKGTDEINLEAVRETISKLRKSA